MVNVLLEYVGCMLSLIMLNAFGAGTYNNKPEQMLLLHKF